jgi:hypothetical protein
MNTEKRLASIMILQNLYHVAMLAKDQNRMDKIALLCQAEIREYAKTKVLYGK